MRWSLQVPGSLSSPLTRTYFGLVACLGTKDHFMPVGKPAPPRPRRFEAFISLMIHSGPCAMALRSGLVAAEFDVPIDVGRALAEAAGDDLDFIGMRRRASALFRPSAFDFAGSSSRTLSIDSGVRFSWKS